VDDWVSAGSSNYDRWSLRWNLEANLEIEDSRFAAAVADMFERDFDDALACEPRLWQRRSWIARTRERFWGTMDRLLQRLGRGPQGGP
jgi:phosphatidylserine/phosphatidylglycerophosphate/cardiolipin synthase-like enzyme